ncbi:MAG: 50S ribosomal protein L7ae [Firmicutes bacterium HGW-Firmicutes-14]|nr:MAG: 50S ribosomal protein L7ae [Firmicutes bacterium HGW-Firmicutes-14]
MIQKGYDLLGLAQKAGQVKSGEAAAEEAINKGKAKLVLVAEDASLRTRDRFISLAKYKKIPWLEIGEKLRLGIAIGKSPRSVVTVTEKNFAKRLFELFGGEEEDF